MCVWVYVYKCVCVYMWKLEVDTGIVLNFFSSFSFEAEALIEPCARQPMKAGQQIPEVCPFPLSRPEITVACC